MLRKPLVLLLVLFSSLVNSKAEAKRTIFVPAAKNITIFQKEPTPNVLTSIDCRNISGTPQTVKMSVETGSHVSLNYAEKLGDPLTPKTITIPDGSSEARIAPYAASIFRIQFQCDGTPSCNFYGFDGRSLPPTVNVAFRIDLDVALYFKLEVAEDMGAVICRVTPYVFGSSGTLTSLLPPTAIDVNGGRPF